MSSIKSYMDARLGAPAAMPLAPMTQAAAYSSERNFFILISSV